MSDDHTAEYTPPQKPTDPLIGKRVGEYLVRSVLGRGGMGTVYRADDTALGIPVALKAIAPNMAADEAFVRRFRTEARAMARVASPHIVRVMALREVETAPGVTGLFIVMEFVDGGDLHARMAHGPIPWTELWPLLRQMLLGLEAAHAVGVIHRDIKPRNVLLTKPVSGPSGDAGPVVKLTDFGLARLSDGDATRTQAVAGTLAYMSPEQVRSLPTLDHRSDLFSLGLTAYEALAGRLPFERDGGEFTVMRAIVEESFPPPTAFRGEIPSAVAAALMRSLAKDADQRYQSAEEMREALAAAGDDLTPTLTRVPGRSRLKKTASSRPEQTEKESGGPVVSERSLPLALLALGGLAIAMLVGGVYWFTRPATLEPAMEDGVSYFLDGEPWDASMEVDPGTHEVRCLAGDISATTEIEVARRQTRRVSCFQHDQAIDVSAFWDGSVTDAIVLVNGTDTTAVPARLSLPTGRHVLRIQSAQAGRIDSTVTVDVRPTFDPEPPAPLAVAVRAGEDPTPVASGQTGNPANTTLPPPIITPPPTRPIDPPTSGSSDPPPTTPQVGSIDAVVPAGVTLSVDGSSISSGSRDLRPGTYEARCSAGSLSSTTRVTVTAGQRTPIQCYTPTQAVRISVTSTDAESPWMSVVVNGEALGQTPTQVTLPVGRHSVFVRRRGYEVIGEDMRTIDVPPSFSPNPPAPVPLSFQVRSAQ
ncbi:MAG: serine/threonine-protein kinase [Bacteroidota bacterium]